MSVRQIALAWPSCAQILAAFAGAQSHGRWTLQELGYFVRAHGVDEQQMLRQLSDAAGVPVGESKPSRREASPLPLIWVALAVSLTLGASWGVMLLLRIAAGADYAAVSGPSVHVHGVAQLWGWMALFIFGVGTHLLRQTTTRPAPLWLERAAAGCVVVALLGFFAGLSTRLRHAVWAIDILASSLLLIAAILFGISVAWSLSGANKNSRRHGFAFLIGWLWIWAATDLFLRIHYARADVLPDAARTLLIVLPVLGLGANAIFGFGVRLIPGLLNIGNLRAGFFSVALILYNLGLCLFLVPVWILGTIGAGMMVIGAVFYVLGMDRLRSKPSRPIYGIDPRGHVLIRVAFFWLVAGLLMIFAQQFFLRLPHAYSGAWRDALTVGFITTMILGVGQRIIPIFVKQPLASTRLMLVSAVLIILGNAGRVGLELATMGGWPWTFRAMGATGVLELSALLLFAINIAMTVRNHRRTYQPGQRLTANVRVRQAVNVHPELQQRFRELGIRMFDEVPFIAPSMTFGALALACGFQPADLVAKLYLR